jgi:hypothetical protein
VHERPVEEVEVAHPIKVDSIRPSMQVHVLQSQAQLKPFAYVSLPYVHE